MQKGIFQGKCMPQDLKSRNSLCLTDASAVRQDFDTAYLNCLCHAFYLRKK